MDAIVLELKKSAKRELLLALLAELDFFSVKENVAIDVHEVSMQAPENGSLFNLVELWGYHDIDEDTLRAAAWRR